MFGVACGLAAFGVSWVFLAWQLAVLIGWDVMCVVIILRAWAHVWSFSPRDTQAFAVLEDDSRAWSDFVLLSASLISLVGVAAAFVKANDYSSGEELTVKLVGIATIFLSWFVVHTIFAFKYAHRYYADPVGGIDFKADPQEGEGEPDYRDFAYLSFTVGMTYQVADTDVTQRKMRHVVLRHALLSFVFGAVILATTVNLIASLLNG